MQSGCIVTFIHQGLIGEGAQIFLSLTAEL
jgi:hypothetical protein